MIYDSHMHTVNSDGRSTIAEMCQSAVEKGVSGITITDHAHLTHMEEYDILPRIQACIDENLPKL